MTTPGIVYERIDEHVVPGKRLGRHRHHDPRSRDYPVEAAPMSSLRSVTHRRLVKPFDQGSLGSCTGNACAGALSTQPFRHRFGERTAVGLYKIATAIDPYPGQFPPTDTGSDGLSVAKAAQRKGWCASYRHAFSLAAALTALQTLPVITGTSWHDGMDTPASDGRIQPTGDVRGGHEYEIDEIDVANRRVWMVNSWGPSWGLAGRAFLTWDDWGTLLSEGGDVTVLIPATVP